MTIALIDGDVICYNACEDRYTRDTDDLLLQHQEYTEIRRVEGEDVFSDEENEAYLNAVFEKFKRLIEGLQETCYATEVRVAVGGTGNFRKDVFPDYKMNRHGVGVKRNPFVPIIREMAAKEGIAVQAHGMEADDLLRIWAEELRAEEKHFVICSVDKDLKCIEGTHWLIHKKTFFESTPDYAMRFYYEQLLQGDATDNIQGVPGIGPLKAQSFLANCVTEEDFQSTVMQVYYSTVHQWRRALQLTGQLIYIKKHRDDWFDMSKWPVITLEDIVNKPKKGKMEEWTLDTALNAVNPFSITTRARWEAAMLYLLEATPHQPKEVEDAVAVLMERDKVPNPEKVAFETFSTFMKRNIVVTEKDVADESLGAPKMVKVDSIIKLPAIKAPEPVAVPKFSFGAKTPVVPPQKEVPTIAPPPPVVAPPAAPPVVTPPPTTAPTGVPTFNTAWLKKK